MVMHLGEPLPQDRPAFHFDSAVLSMFFMAVYAGMIWTNGCGASTGMFVPALAVGIRLPDAVTCGQVLLVPTVMLAAISCML